MNPMRLVALTSVALTVAFATACTEERAITTEPVGSLGFGQNLVKAQSNLPRGRAIFPTAPIASATPATDSIIVELGGLDSLSSGNYVVWVGNDSATKFVRASGLLTVLRTDTTLNAQGDAVFSTPPRARPSACPTPTPPTWYWCRWKRVPRARRRLCVVHSGFVAAKPPRWVVDSPAALDSGITTRD